MSEFFRKPIVKTLMLKGQEGQSIKGITKTGTDGLVDTYTITLTDGTTSTFTVTNGREISSIRKTETSGLVDTYTIEFNDGTTSTFTVTNGKGISNISKTETSGLVDTYTIEFNDGTNSTFTVTNGDSAYKPAVEALGKRIDNLILSSGTESSAEVVDARTGYDGTAYPTLGTAIRSQVSELKGDLTNRVPKYADYNLLVENGKGYSDTGATYVDGITTIKISSPSSTQKYIYDFKNATVNGQIYLIINYKSNVDTALYIEYDIDGLTWQGQKANIKNTNGKWAYKFIEFNPQSSFRVRAISNLHKLENIEIKYKLILINENSLINVLNNHLVTPELFGCLGDGITSDKEELQYAINMCNKYGYTLTSQQNKIYLIDGSITINFDKINIDFGGATLKSAYADEHFIRITNKSSADNLHSNFIQNINIDCNNISGGIYIPYGFKLIVDKLNVKNCKLTAFRVDEGAEVFLKNSHIHCNGNYASIGILMNTSDCHFNDIVIIDARRCISNAGTNFFSRVHGWNISIWDDTTFFEHLSGNVILSECQMDTVQIGVDYKTSRKLSLIGCTYFLNTNASIYTNATNKANTIIKLKDSSLWYSRKIALIGCNLAGASTTRFCNLLNQIQLIDYQSTGHISDIDKTIINSPLTDTFENTTLNQLYNLQGKTYLKITTDVKENKDTDLLLVEELPSDIFYQKYGEEHKFIASFVNKSTGEVTQRQGYIYEGKVYVNTKGVSISGKTMIIDTCYTERNID